MNLCWIIPIITAIIGAILGWLLRHLTCNDKQDLNEIERLRDKNKKLELDLAACRAKKSVSSLDVKPEPVINTTTSNFAASSAPPVAALVFDAGLAKSILGKKVVADDLKVIEGIGPKIAELFNNNGITTWKQLSEASLQRCQEILDKGGKRYEIHKPNTWPKQAGLAHDGKWKELLDLQDYLDGGVEPK